MGDVQPIPREMLDKAHRKLVRGIGAQILMAMADTDTSFALIAVRLGVTEKKVRKWMDKFMDGNANSLRVMSDMLSAMGAELYWRIELRPQEPQAPPHEHGHS